MSRSTILRAAVVTSFVLSALVLKPVFASTTWTVRQDGSGDFTTINAARAVATTGDIIEVGPGVYPELIDFSYAVTLRSTDGAAATILDGEDVRRILIFRAGTGSVVDGFTLKRGYFSSSAAALRVQLGATATVQNCVFEDNHSAADGGAIICRDSGSRIDLANCTFYQNTSPSHGGAVIINTGGICTFDHCVFEENAGASCGGIQCLNASCTVTNSLFVRNLGTIGALRLEESTGVVTGNTFYDNSVQISLSTYTLVRNMFVHNPDRRAIGLQAGTVVARTCNLFWDNFMNVADAGLVAGEIDVDPVLCDPDNGDFSVSIHSPAAPANSPCGQLIGAFPAACDIPAPPPTLWEPVITAVVDVPDDQGNAVQIKWRRSYFDRNNAYYIIPEYQIYRRHDESFARSHPPGTNIVRAESAALEGWDLVATVPANETFEYECVVPTLCNKPNGGDPCWSAFLVAAPAENSIGQLVNTLYSSPDSGYSEDNIPPGPPPAFAVDKSAGGAELSWTAPTAPDLAGYRVYRAEGADPVVGPGTLVHSTSATTWSDPDATIVSHYLVSALDINGNEGEAASPLTATPVANTLPASFALRQNVPNPFNPSTRIAFEVPRGGGDVRIEIYDVTGRRVRMLMNEHRPAGTWTVQWDGTSDRGIRVASGVYFYRFRARDFEQTLRMTLLE